MRLQFPDEFTDNLEQANLTITHFFLRLARHAVIGDNYNVCVNDHQFAAYTLTVRCLQPPGVVKTSMKRRKAKQPVSEPFWGINRIRL